MQVNVLFFHRHALFITLKSGLLLLTKLFIANRNEGRIKYKYNVKY